MSLTNFSKFKLTAILCIATTVSITATQVNSADWSNTEVQLQYGSLDNPSFAGGGSSSTGILTLQHASGWKYGDNFFFIDLLDSEDGDETEFNNNDAYGEWYSNFSIGKIRGNPISIGQLMTLG